LRAAKSSPDARQGASPSPKRTRVRHGRFIALGLLLITLCLAYTQKDGYAYRAAQLSHNVLGDEATAYLEGWYFRAQDKADQLKYRVFGKETANPFGDSDAAVSQDFAVSPIEQTEVTITAAVEAPEEPAAPPEPAKPAPLYVPSVRQLSSQLQAGEGVWTTEGLPRTNPQEPLMVKTFVRPDRTRPYATVGLLLMDHRRVKLHIMGGTKDPGGDLGVKGPGLIPPADVKDLLAAWNGGFRGPHGNYGMYADGKQYRALRNGLASVAVTRDGSILMGEWGRDMRWSPDLVAVRQNAVLLVENCEVSRRTNEGNNTWGYVQVNSAEFITWRSAIGVTEHGDLLVAAGNSLSAASLAKALWAAGACYAMQLDINSPYVLTSLYFPQADGTIGRSKFMESMPDNPSRFLNRQAKDFMYLTLDETNYKP